MGCSNTNTNIQQKPNHSSETENKNEQKDASKRKSDRQSALQSEIAPNLACRGILNRENLAKHYKIIEKLGSGTFGRVYKAIHSITKQLRAIKVVKKDVLRYQDDEKKFLKEIELLATLTHPNIIKIFEYFVDDANYYVVQEYATGGELYEQIYKLQTFSERDACLIMFQLISAVAYLHSKDIVHRDLKPENIMLESKKPGEFNIKLIDFGAANYCQPKEGVLTLKVGTPYYIAPEVIKKKYDIKCDLWSCGIILYILLCGYPPFDGDNDQEIMKNVAESEFNFDGEEWVEISKEAKNLIKKLLRRDPKSRISAEEALKDNWIKHNLDLSKENVSKTQLKHQYKNLKNFSAKTKLQQASIAFLVHQLTTNETTKELRSMFKKMDESGDGKLSYNELRKGFNKYYNDGGGGLSDQEFQDLITKLDQDNNGFVEYEEFLSATVNLELLLTEKNLHMAFAFFDKDGSGKLDVSEVKGALGMISKSDQQGSKDEFIRKLIQEIDTNNDGEVSYDEFKILMRKVLPRSTV